MEHFSQSPGLGLQEREEELRWPAMMEWIFFERAPVDSRRGRMVWIGSKNPHPFNRRFIYLARGANVKMPWFLAFARRVEDSPYWAQKPRSLTFMGAGHYLADIQDYEKNLPCNA